jgi:hypothetical protein
LDIKLTKCVLCKYFLLSVDCLFNLMTIFFSVQKLLSFIQPYLSIMKQCYILSVAFFCICCNHNKSLAHYSVTIVCQIYWFAYVAPTLHLQNEFNLTMMNDPLTSHLNWVCLYFVENFCIYVHCGYWLIVFFSCVCFSGFCIRES